MSRVLIAGIGNIFLGDDAFGVEVARRCAARDWPGRVVVRECGIRCLDLAFLLLDPWDLVIAADTVTSRSILDRRRRPGSTRTAPDSTRWWRGRKGWERRRCRPCG